MVGTVLGLAFGRGSYIMKVMNNAYPPLKNKGIFQSYHPLYSRFRDIKKRCNNKNCKSYRNYGARGIRCLWKSFGDFRDDMYESYLKHVQEFGDDTYIERIDNDGSYSRENCRWATMSEQNHNRRPFRSHYLDGRRGSHSMV